jgi:hypothetical protein
MIFMLLCPFLTEIILKDLWLRLKYLTLQMGENQQEKISNNLEATP